MTSLMLVVLLEESENNFGRRRSIPSAPTYQRDPPEITFTGRTPSFSAKEEGYASNQKSSNDYNQPSSRNLARGRGLASLTR
jgi:hypothetical protein